MQRNKLAKAIQTEANEHSPHPAASPRPETLVPALLGWFSKNARDLPWRRTRDPYAIWVSEIMLQQTQVKTVIPYWERWMHQLPSIPSLAEAPSEQIHKLWEGLGYYTRVRNLKKAAQRLCAEHGGRLPQTFDEILALPGIGRYTAGAICSMAFDQPTPILDGNVMRVLARLYGLTKDPRENPTNPRLWHLAQQLVETAALLPRNSARATPCSHLNQSLMELGALICTPRQPRCEICPVQAWCLAFRTGQVEAIPNLGRRVRSTARRFVAWVAEARGRFLVRQRRAGLVNAHLWEFPNVEVTLPPSDLKRAAEAALGFRTGQLRPLCVIKHSITRYRITLETFQTRLAGRAPDQGTFGAWLALEELDALALTSAHRKILTHLATAHHGKVSRKTNRVGDGVTRLSFLPLGGRCREEGKK